MSIWFLPEFLPNDLLGKALVRKELLLPAEGLPDLSRAQSFDQIAGWLAVLMPETPPELIGVKAQHYWQLAHDVTLEDHIVLPAPRDMLMIGEITGVYRYEPRDGKPSHIWPITWLSAQIAQADMTELKPYFSRNGVTEITDEKLLGKISQYIPSRKRHAVTIFKWIAVITLISELIYFWPR